jgi:hypothetical protein
MNIHQSFAAPPPAKPRVSGDRGALLTALVHLWPYIWPSDRRDLKLRVLLATGLLLLAKRLPRRLRSRSPTGACAS